MGRVQEVLRALKILQKEKKEGVSATDIGKLLYIDRSNVSRYLNILYREGYLEKIEGRPVLYRLKPGKKDLEDKKSRRSRNSLDKLVGADQSLSLAIEKAKAAILYPPKGLHTLILGETGVGKSMFAELMYYFALENKVISEEAPFIRFNCADYAHNQNLLTGQIFGVKKGTYTGATEDRDGLLKKADGGFIFLDEIHRLSPQGQEMLFTYIDNGFFRPLGETEKLEFVDVRIIAATTENPKSNLLRTFTRRIPMTITLPSLKDRSLSERYSFIETFIKEESHRIGRSIYINKNAIISYLLYSCPNNIGQLKSDIQLACAKAYLNYRSDNTEYILITQGDLPNHVKKGIMKVNQYRKEIEELLNINYEVLKFSQYEEPPLLLEEDKYTSEDFYNNIEKKLKSLKDMGMDGQEINEIINIDIESHFEKYLGDISHQLKRSEVASIVEQGILELVEEILILAEQELNKKFNENIYFALSLHLDRSIKRLRQGESIYNPKLNSIRINYEKEFLFAMRIAKLIDQSFQIEIPVDEIGYLAMFFAAESYDEDKAEKPKVGVLVIMHGDTTASSMVNVANNLIGTNHAIGLDMPLDMKIETMYKIAKKKVLEVDQGEGVILLVDMGSLTSFGHMIEEETGIKIKTIDSASTPIVLEVLRKAIVGYSIDEILDSFQKKYTYEFRENVEKEEVKNLILVACLTGDGASKKLQAILKSKTKNEDIEIFTINIIDKINLEKRLYKLKDKYNILTIISTIPIEVTWTPVFSGLDIIMDKNLHKIEELLEENRICLQVAQSLEKHLSNIRAYPLVKEVRYLIYEIQNKLNIFLDLDVKVGIILHICFLIDNLIRGNSSREFEEIIDYERNYSREMAYLKELFLDLELKYNINIGKNEIAYILKLFLANKLVCNIP